MRGCGRIVRFSLPFVPFALVACGGSGRTEAPPKAAPPPTVSAMSKAPPPAPAHKRLPVETRRDDVVDDLHGVAIADPYRWLEDGTSAEVEKWTADENAYTRRVLDAVPNRDGIHRRLEELLTIGVVGSPAVRKGAHGTRYFHVRREGAENQPILYVRDGLHGADRPLVDPNGLAKDGTTALDWWSPSNDGKLLAYGLSQNGDEDSTLYVRDVATGKDLADRIAHTRYCSVAWLPDGSGFYYTRYPAKGTVPAGEENYHRTVFFHRLGDDTAKDASVFGEGRTMTDSPSVVISPGGRWLVARVHEGWDKSEVYLKDLHAKNGAWVPVATGIHAVFDPDARDDALYVRTNDGAPRYRLFRVDPTKPAREHWKEIVPQGEDVLADFAVVGRDLVVTYLHDASSRLVRMTLDGKGAKEIPLPTLGSSAGATGFWNGDEAFFDFSSFAVPPTIHRIDLKTGKAEVWDAIKAPIDPDAFEVERLRAKSKDGTEVPIFVVHKKGLVKDGKTPTVLNGYGGFDISLQPTFQRSTYLLLEHGGVFAVANLRGGGEFGEGWHKAGMLEHKQNVFDDAIAAAEALIADGYTDKEHLAVMGGSNGGLLVGALVTQRPDLFRAAVCSVPLLDMLRYQRFLIAKLWVPEYGSADDPEQFKWLYAYSPYHHVKEGTRYPAVLFTAAESDSRVDPLHARKMAAEMQWATSSDRPILLRIETKAGHGAGKPVTKVVEELTDVYSFLFAELGVKLPVKGM